MESRELKRATQQLREIHRLTKIERTLLIVELCLATLFTIVAVTGIIVLNHETVSGECIIVESGGEV